MYTEHVRMHSLIEKRKEDCTLILVDTRATRLHGPKTAFTAPWLLQLDGSSRHGHTKIVSRT